MQSADVSKMGLFLSSTDFTNVNNYSRNKRHVLGIVKSAPFQMNRTPGNGLKRTGSTGADH